MKLFARDNVCEGQIYRDDAIFVFGQLTDHKGWYVLFNLIFIQKDVDDYVDKGTWEKRPARCYYRTSMKLRYRSIDNRWLFYRVSVWDEVIDKEKQ